MSNKKEVATTGFSDTLPSYMNPEKARGSEDVGTEDITIPRLSIIQDLSPQHKKTKEEYIEGAESGMVFNTVTGELFEGPFYVVFGYYRKEWVIWRDQGKGGGFRGSFESEVEAVRELAKLEDKEECEVTDTAQHFVLLVKESDGEFICEEAVISMSKSQMKVNRKLNSAIRLAGGDRFSRVYSMQSVVDQNAAGQEYFNWSFKQNGYAPEAVYKRAEALYEAIKAGERKVAHDDVDKDAGNTKAPEKAHDDVEF